MIDSNSRLTMQETRSPEAIHSQRVCLSPCFVLLHTLMHPFISFPPLSWPFSSHLVLPVQQLRRFFRPISDHDKTKSNERLPLIFSEQNHGVKTHRSDALHVNSTERAKT